ncbi:hypothetical protein Q0M94_03455 [Deinococcus radiomollis]|uniref:hypothetical protein n=1 Tax=Deinococcus radiomollis TaxID=468916 RepID=UPI003892C84F
MILDLFNQFKAALPPSMAALPHHFGKLALAENGSYPRVVWVPAGSDRFTPGMSGLDSNRLPFKALSNRQVSIEIHFWGQDDASAEAMMENYLGLLLSVYGTAACQPTHGYFMTEQDAAYEHDGSVYVLALVLDHPIVKPETWALLNSIAADCC